MKSEKHFSFEALALMAGLWAGLSAGSVEAVSFTVTIDTTALASQPIPPAPFSLEFQVNDGGGTVTNIVTLSNFDFGAGGGAVGTPTYNCTSGTGAACGGISGNLSGTVTLTDGSDAFNEFIQQFTPSATDSLSFLLDLTTNVEPITPDAFSLAILDWQGQGIPTSFFDVFVQIDITSPLTVATYASDPNSLGLDIPEPVVRSAAIPEPGTLLLLVIGLAGLARRDICRTQLEATDFPFFFRGRISQEMGSRGNSYPEPTMQRLSRR